MLALAVASGLGLGLGTVAGLAVWQAARADQARADAQRRWRRDARIRWQMAGGEWPPPVLQAAPWDSA